MFRKAQFSVEFMIVFSFVLLVFLFLFAMITSQRSLGLSDQLFSQMQLIAQSIALQINNAISAGSGYSTSMHIGTTVGLVPYNLTITKNGMIIVSAYVGKQLTQARAYSMAKSIVSSPSFATSSSQAYLMPIQNGTLYIQNSYGTICIDYSCQSPTASTPQHISMTEQNVHVANFNGQSSYITVPTSNAVSFNGPSVTVAFWIYPVPSQYWGASGNYWENAVSVYPSTACTGGGAGTGYNFFIESGGNPPTESWTADNVRDFPGKVLQPYKWQMLVGVANSTYINVYYDGEQIGTPIATNGITTFTSPPTIRISGSHLASSGPGCNPVSGDLANVQIYNTSLSASEIQALYQEGIDGTPIQNAGLVGWWPLDGNANDYSGFGNNGEINGPVIFTAVSQLFAKVTSGIGYAVSNALVGFTTTFGSLSGSGGYGSATTNYTNSNGIATAFLNQQGNNGYALVKASVFNGNQSLQRSLVGWWPLNINFGTTAYDLSGNRNNGTISGYAAWSSPNFIAGFDGSNSSYIQITTPVAVNTISTAYTLDVWINQSYAPANLLILGNTSCIGISSSPISKSDYSISAWLSGSATPFGNVPYNSWQNIAVVYNGIGYTTRTVYVNGVAVGIDSSGSVSSCNDYPKMWYNASANVAKGEMANAQMYATALSANQIQQLYQEGISAPPIAGAGLVGWWPLNGNANDYSGNGNNGTVYGAISFVPQNLAASNYTSSLAANFNGQSSVITAPISLNSSSFSIVFWTDPANQLKITSSNGYTVMNSVGTNTLEIWLNNGAGAGASPGSGDEELGIGSNYYHGFGVNANTWDFIGVSVNNGKISFYANGVGPYNVSGVSGPYNVNSISLAQSAAGISMFNGSIANFQIYNTALSTSEIQALYQEGISGVPISNAGLVGWWPLDGNANDYSGFGNNGTATNVGYVGVVSRTYNPISSLSNYGLNFNGYGGYVSLPPLHTLNGHNSFTINAWINYVGGAQYFNQNPYPVGWPGCHAGFMFSSPSSLTFFEWYTSNSINPPGCPTSGGGIAPASATVQPNTSYMVTGVYNNATGVLDFYVNGAYHSSAIVPSGDYISNYDETGYIGDALDGNTGTHFFDGSVGDVQIYNTALSSLQVQQLYNSQLQSASATIPMSWYP
ncbi:MAG: LamG-like jellyroll fold domain-containing protein [Candidatus Micrarchaeaceae archaeon]